MERVKSTDIRITLDQDRQALAVYSSYWSNQKVKAALNEDCQAFAKIDRTEQATETYLNQALGDYLQGRRFGLKEVLDRFSEAISWQRQKDTPTDFSELVYLGIDPKGLESVWPYVVERFKDYQERSGLPAKQSGETDKQVLKRSSQTKRILADLDRRYRSFFTANKELTDRAIAEHFQISLDPCGVESKLTDLVDQRLAQELAVEEAPISSKWLSDTKINGLNVPPFEHLVGTNRAILEDRPVDLYCCPNYDTDELEGGVRVYRFRNLGVGIGLTAERSFPFVAALIRRASTSAINAQIRHPLHLRIGVADFEANESNAALVDLSVNDFKDYLNRSLAAMVHSLTRQLTGLRTSAQRSRPEKSALDQFQIRVKSQDQMVANITVGGITDLYLGTPDYNGRQTFDLKTDQQRQILRERAAIDATFQRQLDKLLRIRLGLILRWRDGSEPPLVRKLGNLYDELTHNGYKQGLDGSCPFPDLKSSINHVVAQSGLSYLDKDRIAKTIILDFIRNGTDYPDLEKEEAILYLRRRVAAQGAEYKMMGTYARQCGVGAQIIADSYAMWQVFGGSLPRIAISGGYLGS